MTGGHRIRRAVEPDAVALARLAEHTFRAAFEAANTAENMRRHCAASYAPALQRAEIRDAARETWVAEVAQNLVAYVQLRLESKSPVIRGRRPLEIQRFYVEASHHGQGLAHELMAHVLARATVVRSDLLWLGVWEQNPRALAFYRKWGFVEVGEHTFLLGEDPQRDVVMCRELQASGR